MWLGFPRSIALFALINITKSSNVLNLDENKVNKYNELEEDIGMEDGYYKNNNNSGDSL